MSPFTGIRKCGAPLAACAAGVVAIAVAVGVAAGAAVAGAVGAAAAGGEAHRSSEACGVTATGGVADAMRCGGCGASAVGELSVVRGGCTGTAAAIGALIGAPAGAAG